MTVVQLDGLVLAAAEWIAGQQDDVALVLAAAECGAVRLGLGASRPVYCVRCAWESEGGWLDVVCHNQLRAHALVQTVEHCVQRGMNLHAQPSKHASTACKLISVALPMCKIMHTVLQSHALQPCPSLQGWESRAD